MSNPKIVYKVKYFEETDLQRQLDWTNKSLTDASKNDLKFKTLRGEIYKYKKTNNKMCFIIVLMDTKEINDEVLICPIYINRNEEVYVPGLDIGLIPELSLKYNFVAAIQEIHFINKNKFVLDKYEMVPIYYGRLLEITYLEIIYNYKKLLEFALRNKNKSSDVHSC